MEKDKIIIKTAQLVKKYGFKSLTIDDIATFLLVSKSALYTHFQNKEELIKNSLDFINKDFETTIEMIFIKKENPIKKLIEVNNAAIDFLNDFYEIFFFDLKKSQNRNEIIKGYQISFKNNIILPLLIEAKKSNYLIEDLNLEAAFDQYIKHIGYNYFIFKVDNSIIKKQIIIFMNRYLTEEYKRDYNYLLDY